MLRFHSNHFWWPSNGPKTILSLVEHHLFIHGRNCLAGPYMQPAVCRCDSNDFSGLPWFHSTFHSAHELMTFAQCELNNIETYHDCCSTSNIQHAMAKMYGCQVSMNHSHGHHQPHQCNSWTIEQHSISPCVAVSFETLDYLNELINRRALFSRCVH